MQFPGVALYVHACRYEVGVPVVKVHKLEKLGFAAQEFPGGVAQLFQEYPFIQTYVQFHGVVLYVHAWRYEVGVPVVRVPRLEKLGLAPQPFAPPVANTAL